MTEVLLEGNCKTWKDNATKVLIIKKIWILWINQVYLSLSNITADTTFIIQD